MGTKVTIEGKRVVTSLSKHTASASPDLCLTPQGPAMVPVPYVNQAKSADLKGGSRKVRVRRGAVMLKQSQIARSTGNELGTAGGVKSKQTCGPCRAVQTSRLVRIEGQTVVLGGCVTLQNGDNAIGRLAP